MSQFHALPTLKTTGKRKPDKQAEKRCLCLPADPAERLGERPRAHRPRRPGRRQHRRSERDHGPATSPALPPANGCQPNTVSYRTTQRDQTSSASSVRQRRGRHVGQGAARGCRAGQHGHGPERTGNLRKTGVPPIGCPAGPGVRVRYSGVLSPCGDSEVRGPAPHALRCEDCGRRYSDAPHRGLRKSVCGACQKERYRTPTRPLFRSRSNCRRAHGHRDLRVSPQKPRRGGSFGKRRRCPPSHVRVLAERTP